MCLFASRVPSGVEELMCHRRLKHTSSWLSSYEMTFRYPDDPENQRVLLRMDSEQRQLHDLLR